MKSLKILVVDDYEGIRDILEQILKKSHKVVKASSGEDGLKLFFQDNFDLVITDREMSEEMPGEEVIRKVKLSKPGVKTILMSAMVGEEVRQVAKAAGADCFIDKMYLFTELESAMKNLFPALLAR